MRGCPRKGQPFLFCHLNGASYELFVLPAGLTMANSFKEISNCVRKIIQLLLASVLVNRQGEDVTGHLHRKSVAIEAGIREQIFPMDGQTNAVLTQILVQLVAQTISDVDRQAQRHIIRLQGREDR